VPGFEVKLVEGFTENKPHYHQTFDEAYYNIAGALTVKLTPHSTGVSQTLDVPVGGCALIPRYTDHHVLGGSNDNKILVFYWPRFNGKPGNDWHPA
jgi:mannose-6-phosphate isomerase-like protein (cupin superfamily)